MTAKEAYEADCKRCPNYCDGTKRKSWHELKSYEKEAWIKNPTPREFNHHIRERI